MEPIAFRSSRTIAAEREQLREARKNAVDKAKSNFQNAEKKKEENKKRGYDDWILPSVLETIDKQSSGKSKSKKSKKDKKKHKKSKKKKKKHASSDSDSDDSSEGEEIQWVEKGTGKKANEPSISKPVLEVKKAEEATIYKPALARDDWMGLGFDALPTISRQEIRDKEKKVKDEEKKLFDQPGQHQRELNPYWKDGGVGLPEEEKKEKEAPLPHISWLRRAYKRCEEQAKETCCSMEEVAAERWGSLRKLESMIKKAQKIENEKQGHSSDRNNSTPHQNRPYQTKSKYQGMFKRPSDSPPPSDHRTDNSRVSPSESNRSHSRSDYDTGRRGMFKRPSDSPPPSDRRTDNSRVSPSESNRSHSRSDYDTGRRGMFKRPSDSPPPSDRRTDNSRVSPSESNRSHSRSDYDTGRRGMFKRPSDSPPPSDRRTDNSSVSPSESNRSQSRSDYDTGRRSSSGLDRDRYGRYSNRESGSYVPGWKKKSTISEERAEDPRSTQSMKEEMNQRSTTKNVSDSSSSSSSDSDSSEKQEEDEERPPSPVIILTEDQMNDLSAKILRAELMGDDDLVESLQNKLKAAQKAKAEYSASNVKQPSKDEQEEVLLTHVDHNGMAWPLLGKEEKRPQGRQRKKNIKTHGNAGERVQYFDDDDKHDLKQLVQREKMSSAEDQNSMFARLAGRSIEKTDEDYQIDDVFVSRAAKKESEAKTFDLQKARAIFEHKKMSSSIANCRLCFEKVAKHLLISIGQKAYLCLPDGASLTEGHCLIVPIQHITSSTAMDEDVWQEVQSFKKALVKMFLALGKDTIFMETSMYLNKFPHACIECVPLEKEDGTMAPMYFKKAILESESEWCMNKKLVDLFKKDIRRSIPKGFPFFAVNFAMDGGFAHAIEDEKKFPFYFGKEIIGGLIDADPSLFRKPRKEQFEVQRQKVLQFDKMWKPYDFTQNQ